MGETSRENSGEASAAKFLSNSEADNCRREKQPARFPLSPLQVSLSHGSLAVLFGELNPP